MGKKFPPRKQCLYSDIRDSHSITRTSVFRREQEVEAKKEIFPFTKYDTIDAEVIDVSNDAITDDQRELVDAGRVIIKKSVIQFGRRPVNLAPGMVVTVEVRMETRRLVE